MGNSKVYKIEHHGTVCALSSRTEHSFQFYDNKHSYIIRVYLNWNIFCCHSHIHTFTWLNENVNGNNTLLIMHTQDYKEAHSISKLSLQFKLHNKYCWHKNNFI